MSVRLEGIAELTEKLDGLIDPVKIKSAMGTACALVERTAKQKAPKDSGELRRSITSKVEGEGANTIGVVFTPLEYAPYIEFGTGLFAEEGGRKDVPWAYEDEKTGELIWTCGNKPQPYLRPALNENREEIKRLLATAIVKQPNE